MPFMYRSLFRFGYAFPCESSYLGLLCFKVSFSHSSNSPSPEDPFPPQVHVLLDNVAVSGIDLKWVWLSVISWLVTCALLLTWYLSYLLCGMDTVWTVEIIYFDEVVLRELNRKYLTKFLHVFQMLHDVNKSNPAQ